jgi:simple sugar transport system ATP-binding protein|tara:strand:- start:122 stop:373 length:252 start_codon:yes stop_codon:yes gene_type:complete
MTATSVRDFDIHTPSVLAPAGHLSGGNRQKPVVACELSRETEPMIVGQPARGVAVGAIEYLHNRLVAARNEDDSVLMISSELD